MRLCALGMTCSRRRFFSSFPSSWSLLNDQGVIQTGELRVEWLVARGETQTGQGDPDQEKCKHLAGSQGTSDRSVTHSKNARDFLSIDHRPGLSLPYPSADIPLYCTNQDGMFE